MLGGLQIYIGLRMRALNWRQRTQHPLVHQRSDTMYSQTPFPGMRTNVVRLLHTENVALLVFRLYTKSEELARLYRWFMPSKRLLSDVT